MLTEIAHQVQSPDVIVIFAELFDHLPALVPASIINKNDLKLVADSGQDLSQAMDKICQGVLAIEYRDNDRNIWCTQRF